MHREREIEQTRTTSMRISLTFDISNVSSNLYAEYYFLCIVNHTATTLFWLSEKKGAINLWNIYFHCLESRPKRNERSLSNNGCKCTWLFFSLSSRQYIYEASRDWFTFKNRKQLTKRWMPGYSSSSFFLYWIIFGRKWYKNEGA